jgi:hypothetical protein
MADEKPIALRRDDDEAWDRELFAVAPGERLGIGWQPDAVESTSKTMVELFQRVGPTEDMR